jgi:hypothetical protein
MRAKVALDAVDDGFEISVIKLHLTGERNDRSTI